MSDTIKRYPAYSDDVFKALLDLASCEPEQRKELRDTFFASFNRFRSENIQFGNAELYWNSINLYQVEWPLFDNNTRCVGTLVFGRKIPTTYGQDPLRKFWLRSPDCSL